MSLRKTTNIFIQDSIKIHGNKFDYSLTNYMTNHDKVKIICPIHGIFEIRPNDHLSKKVGCNKCFNAGISKKNNASKNIIDKFKKTHEDKYIYDLVNYEGVNNKVEIICRLHGKFNQYPKHHIMGCGCPECGNVKKMTNEIFIQKSIKIHNNNYNYSLVDYKNNVTKVKIVCHRHGIFEVRPNDHLNKKSGCPVCRLSKGELSIRNFLIENKIIFEPQKRFLNCKNQKTLPFDFYLPELKICIEYDGRQHYTEVPHWGGLKGLKKINKNDNIKQKYCDQNNIKLIRIIFNDNIMNKLENNIKIK